MAWFWTIIQLLIRFTVSFLSCDIKMLHGIWYKIGGLNQQISYSNLPEVISRVFQDLKNNFLGGFMACFQIIIQLLIRSLPSFGIYGEKKYYLEFESKLKEWIKRYLIENWHRLFHGCFKSYRIFFGVALWLDFGQLSSYLFVYRRLFRVTISKCYMEFDTNWRIEWRDILFKLTTCYLKGISSHIE